jgi:toxin ParE1/3/4
MGIAEYREAHFKPYRIIYRVANRTVEVYCVLDCAATCRRCCNGGC